MSGGGQCLISSLFFGILLDRCLELSCLLLCRSIRITISYCMSIIEINKQTNHPRHQHHLRDYRVGLTAGPPRDRHGSTAGARTAAGAAVGPHYQAWGGRGGHGRHQRSGALAAVCPWRSDGGGMANCPLPTVHRAGEPGRFVRRGWTER